MKSKNKVLDFFITSFNGMAIGLFSTLIIAVIIGQFGKIASSIGLNEISAGLTQLSSILRPMMGIGIGFGIALALKLEGIKLVVTGIAGGIATALFNDPMVAYLTTISAFLALTVILKKRTPVDIILVPLLGVLVAFMVAKLIGSPVQTTMGYLGDFIQSATDLQPFLMGVIIAVIMGMALTAPISSAAIAISISLGGIAGGAAVVGCSVQMVGFAVMSRKDNNIGTVISVFIGTSMLQFKNILRKPIIWLPTIIVSAILGPIATLILKTETVPQGAGMGTSGLVGQFATLDAMGHTLDAYISIIGLQIIAPLVLVYSLDYLFRSKGLIKVGDLKI